MWSKLHSSDEYRLYKHSSYADMLEPLHRTLEKSRLDAIQSTTEVVTGISSDALEALDTVSRLL